MSILYSTACVVRSDIHLGDFGPNTNGTILTLSVNLYVVPYVIIL